MNQLYFNGRGSSDLNLVVSGKNVYDGPQRDVEYLSVPGQDGDILIDNGRFINVEIGYNCFLKSRLPEATQEIKLWLLSKQGYLRLEDTYDPEHFRLASYMGPFNFEPQFNRFGTTELLFNCKPYRYCKTGEKPIAVPYGGNAMILNHQAFPALPLIYLEGNGNGSLTVNNHTWSFRFVNGNLTFDSERKRIYNTYPDGKNYGQAVTGSAEIPVLLPGENEVSAHGDITKFEIVPRWRTL